MKLRTKLISLALLVALTGCAQVAIRNVEDTPITTASAQPLTLAQVRAAIIRAGAGLKWQMKDEGPNKLIGTLVVRQHTAVVEIPYTETSYSIKYLSSVNLHEANGRIHKNYNGWISNLQRDINVQLTDR